MAGYFSSTIVFITFRTLFMLGCHVFVCVHLDLINAYEAPQRVERMFSVQPCGVPSPSPPHKMFYPLF